jgi:hypothetical protein
VEPARSSFFSSSVTSMTEVVIFGGCEAILGGMSEKLEGWERVGESLRANGRFSSTQLRTD